MAHPWGGAEFVIGRLFSGREEQVRRGQMNVMSQAVRGIIRSAMDRDRFKC
jgi:hypothetical protein